MQWDLQIRQLVLSLILEVGKDGPQYCLMTDYQDIILTFKFHDDWFKSVDKVRIRFASRIPIMKFIVISCSKISRISLLNGG